MNSYSQLIGFKRIILGVIFIFLLASDSQRVHAAAYIKWDCNKEITQLECANKGGVKYIYIYDEIDYQTMVVVNMMNDFVPKDKTFPLVYLNSPGGNLDEAMNIGRILRMRSATVESLDIFHPENTPMCDSACALIAAGAPNRNLYEIGFHRGRSAKRLRGEKYQYAPLTDEEQAPMLAYLREMKISEDLIALCKEVPSNSIYELNLSLDEPFSNQKIVKYGFRTREPKGEERQRLLKLTLIRDDGRDGLAAAAELGDAYASYTLGRRLVSGANGYEKDIRKGLKYLEMSAALDNAYALHELGVIYRDGVEGVKIDARRAYGYFLRGAKRGLAASQNNVGWMLYEGDGVKKNLSEAIYWLTNAVNQGEAFAYGSLGTLRYRGNGFMRDDIETYKLLKLATISMPEGKARNEEKKRLEALKAKMNKTQIALAEQLVVKWRPLSGYTTSMRDKDDR